MHNTLSSLKEMKEEQLVWEVEIKDLGACRPFLGFSLTDQYLLVAITSPDQQNEVSITSFPKENDRKISIPLSLNKFNFPRSGVLTFKGIRFLMDRWEFLLHNFQNDRKIKLKADTQLSLKSLFQNKRIMDSTNIGLSLILERKK